MRCPRCNEATLDQGDVQRCTRCSGSWIANAAVARQLARAQHRRKPKVEWRLDARTALACSTCQQPMETLCLFEVPVDRCREHGAWFDGGELERVLSQAGAGARDGTLLHAIIDVFWMW